MQDGTIACNYQILMCGEFPWYKTVLNLPPIVLKARHLGGSAFRQDKVCLSGQWDGCPLGW